MLLLQTNSHGFLSVSLDTWITAIITVFMFFVGARYSRYLDTRKEKRRLKRVEQYFNVLLGVLDEPMNSQIEKLKEFNAEILQRNQQHLILPKISSFNVDQLKAIKNQDLFEIISLHKNGSINNRVNDLRIILEKIQYFDDVKIAIEKQMVELGTMLLKHSSNYGNNIGIISKYLDGIASDLHAKGINLEDDKFMFSVHIIKSKWTVIKNFPDIYISVESFIQQLHVLCQSTPGDKRADFVLEHTMECILAFQNYETTKEFYHEQFQSYIEGLTKGWSQVINIMKKYPPIKDL